MLENNSTEILRELEIRNDRKGANMYAYDLLVDPQTFKHDSNAFLPSSLPVVDKDTQIKIARMQFEVALREAKTAGFAGDAWEGVRNWVSNALSLGNSFIVHLKDLVIKGITSLFKLFLGEKEFKNMFTDHLKKWIFESLGPIVHQSWLDGANEYLKKAMLLGKDEEIATDYKNLVEAAKENVDYESYLKGFSWCKGMVETGVVNLERQSLKEIKRIPKSQNMEEYLVERVEKEFPARTLIKLVEEAIALINPIGVWKAMEETYKKILGTNDDGGNWGVFKAGASALLVGSVYGLFKYFIYVAFGKVAITTAFGTGVVSGLGLLFQTFIYKYGKVGFAKSSLAKLLMKQFKKLWVKFVKSEKDEFDKSIEKEIEEEAKRSPETIFLENARGKLIPAEQATKEDIQGAVRVAHIHMRRKGLM